MSEPDKPLSDAEIACLRELAAGRSPDTSELIDVPDAGLAMIKPNGPDAQALRAIQAAKAPAQGVTPTKALTTLQARAALVGVELVQLADGSFIAGRWGMVAPLVDVDAVQAFLKRAAPE